MITDGMLANHVMSCTVPMVNTVMMNMSMSIFMVIRYDT
jgi:hypothetical protein